ncbi:MAG: ATP12 family chaperone protein [Acetobacteraceae bacterium]
MKRFWEQATLDPGADGHAILLDGRPLRLPGGVELRVGPAPLAAAIAAEWQAAGGGQGREMSFADTPLTRLAGTAQERIAPDHGPTIATLVRYAESDLLCYRATAPETLVRRQHAAWQPWLDWAARSLDAPLRVAAGIVALRQPRSSIAALSRAVAGRDALVLAALGVAVPALGSLVLGLALAEGALDPVTAHALGALDELYQAERWGEEAEAMTRRRAGAEDIALAVRFMALARGEAWVGETGAGKITAGGTGVEGSRAGGTGVEEARAGGVGAGTRRQMEGERPWRRNG